MSEHPCGGLPIRQFILSVFHCQSCEATWYSLQESEWHSDEPSEQRYHSMEFGPFDHADMIHSHLAVDSNRALTHLLGR